MPSSSNSDRTPPFARLGVDSARHDAAVPPRHDAAVPPRHDAAVPPRHETADSSPDDAANPSPDDAADPFQLEGAEAECPEPRLHPTPRDSSSSVRHDVGKLYVVGTPIGNLGDITERAVQTLRCVDRIAAEDTRHTRRLLSHLQISGKPLDCIEAHVESKRLFSVLAHVEAGASVALVTDAGMPAVSDPGAQLVAEARRRGLPVVVIPGPSALTMAISASGLVEGPFLFLGFLPRQGRRRREALARIAASCDPVIVFESPNRLHSTLGELAAAQPERPAVVCRELTKLHEEVLAGSLAELATLDIYERGELVVVLGAWQSREAEAKEAAPLMTDDELRQELAQGRSVRELLEAAGLTGQDRRAFYRRLLDLKRTIS